MNIVGFPLLSQLGASSGLLMPSPLHMQLLQGQGQLLQGQHSLPLIGQQYLPITPDSSPSTSVPSTASSDVINHDNQSKDHMTLHTVTRSMSRSPNSTNTDYATPQVSNASRNISPHGQSTPIRTSPNSQSTPLRTSQHGQSTPLRTSPSTQHDLTPTRHEALPLLSPHPIGQLMRPEFAFSTASAAKCKNNCLWLIFHLVWTKLK